MGGVEGGGEIFVLDMGSPVKIVDLAKDLIRLSGLTEEDIHIEYTGLRCGEKIHEELLSSDENALPTPHEKLRIAQARQVDEKWLEYLVSSLENVTVLSDLEVQEYLAKLVPEYKLNNVDC